MDLCLFQLFCINGQMFDTSKKRRRINRRKKRKEKTIWIYSLILAVGTAVPVFFLPVLAERFKDVSTKPAADFIKYSTQNHIDKKQTFALVEEVQTGDTSVKEHFELVQLQTVNYKKEVAEMEERRNLPVKESVSDLKQSLDEKMVTTGDEYYVQVSSWKNYEYAEKILLKIKKHYPDVNIVEQDGFYKVRIPGITTKKQAAIISKKIEKQFNLKPLLVLKAHNTSLADAVRTFIGTSYTKIDCYGLVVRGLINQGVQYYGQNGLREKLENLAERDGRPNNAYLTGEGLVEKGGIKLFSKSMRRISNTRERADETYSEIMQYLQEGFVLSFSTPTRGHTGIVSRQGDDWTYINSGVIDNQIHPGSVSERVGEEFLHAEIQNWLDIASRNKEPLTITLGQLDLNQLKALDG
jgi:hypothetical protein